MVKVLVGSALLLSLAAHSQGETRDPGEVVSGRAGTLIDSYFEALESGGFSGTVLVARKGELLLHKGYGLADRERKTPCTTETVFDIGSITKQFTAAAILKLETEGKLRVEDRLSQHLEGVPEDKKDITLHHLLTHTSGLDHAYGEDDDYAPRDLAVRLFLRMPLLTAPGERYHYSNPGFSLLAAVVEKLSGMTYEEYLHDRFFRPAGMAHTGYFLPRWNVLGVSRNYSGDEDNGWTFNRNWGPEGPYWHLYGNGGILSTSGDLHKWEQALMGDRVLPAEARKKLFARHAPENSDAQSFYGYGWRVGTSEQDMAFSGHGGGSGWGVAAAYFRFPEQDILVLVLSNQARFPGGEGASTLTGRIAALAASP